MKKYTTNELQNMNRNILVELFLKLQFKVELLQQKIISLQNEVDVVRVDKKVKLPQAAADAIHYYKSFGYLNLFGIVTCIFSESSVIAIDARRALANIEEPKDLIMSALVNGFYTEDKPEDKIMRDIRDMIVKWQQAPLQGTIDNDMDVISSQIAEHVKKVYEDKRSG